MTNQCSRQQRVWERFFFVLLLGLVFLLSFRQVQTTDAWMHLSFGRLIWETGGFPEHERFCFPSLHWPFSYSSWLFGFLSYAAYSAAGFSGVVLVKTVVCMAAFALVFRDALRPHGNVVVALLCTCAAAVVIQEQFVLRPQIFMYLFLTLSIFTLNAYLYEGRRYLYGLPVVHLLWGNMHSSVPLMAVLFGAFLAGGLIQRFLAPRGMGVEHVPGPGRLRTMLVLCVASLAASAVNPLFPIQYVYGSGIMGSLWNKQLLTELQPPAGGMFVLACVVDAIIVLSFALNRRRFSVAHFLLVAPFLVMPFTAVRFMALPVVVGAPVVARNVSGFLVGRDAEGFTRGTPLRVLSAIAVVVLAVLVLLQLEPVGRRGWRFGFGAEYPMMPVGAVRYLDERNVTGRVLNTFHFGQYIIWTGYPRRTVFIDPRAYVDEKVMEQSLRFLISDDVLDNLHAQYGFESIVIDYGMPLDEEAQILAVRGEAFGHPDWALVYWDDVAMAYLRRGGPYDEIIRKDEYRYVKPNVPLDTFMRQAMRPDRRAGMRRELERNRTSTQSARSRLLVGYYHLVNGSFREALDALEDAGGQSHPGLTYARHFGRGEAYRGMLDTEHSLEAYGEALEVASEPDVLYRLGEAHARLGEYGEAVGYLKRALERRETLENAYPLLARVLRASGREDEAREVEERLAALRARFSGREAFERGVSAYREKKYDDAIAAFREALAVTPASELIHTNLGFAYLDSGRLELAARHFGLALELDAGYANAHYGFGLLALGRGDRGSVREHFRAYLQAEPTGYYSRRARAILDDLEAD